MGPKFKPPLKRKIGTQSQSAHDSDGRATDEPKKAKSSQSDAKAMSTNATEDHALINTNRRGDRYIFGVANGKESAINIKHVAKMSKKFGTVNDKGLEVIKNNNQEVPNVKATQELVCHFSRFILLTS